MGAWHGVAFANKTNTFKLLGLSPWNNSTCSRSLASVDVCHDRFPPFGGCPSKWLAALTVQTSEVQDLSRPPMRSNVCLYPSGLGVRFRKQDALVLRWEHYGTDMCRLWPFQSWRALLRDCPCLNGNIINNHASPAAPFGPGERAARRQIEPHLASRQGAAFRRSLPCGGDLCLHPALPA